MRLFFLFILILSAHLFPNQTSTPQEFASIQGNSRAIVCDCVNVITGDLIFEQDDVVVKGAFPIPFHRRYISREIDNPSLAWDPLITQSAYGESNTISPSIPDRLHIPEPSGISVTYFHEGNQIYRPFQSLFKAGISSYSYDSLGDKYHPASNYAILHGKELRLILPTGQYKTYLLKKRQILKQEGLYLELGFHFLLKEEILSNKSLIKYKFKKSRKGDYNLQRIKTQSACKDATLAAINFEYSDKETVKLKTSDCRTLTYKRKKYKNQHLLHKISSADFPEESLRRNKKLLVKNRSFPNGRSLDIHYDDKNRVISLNGPHGYCYLFSYYEGKTEIFDSYGHRSTYHYDPKTLRLTKIEYFEKGNLVKQEDFKWDVFGNLVAEMFSGKKMKSYLISYTYDKNHNVISKNISGKITSSGTENDSCGTTYRYENNKLVEEQEQNGKKTTFSYIEGTSLLSSRVISHNNHIQVRHFYEYDHNYLLIAEMTDDGSSPDKNNLTDVTMRRIKRLILRKQAPFYGLPETIKHLYLNDGVEKLLRKIDLQYDIHGNITKEDIYDANEIYRYSLSTKYDSRGRILSQTNALGETTSFSYDVNGNKIKEISPTGLVTHYNYDCCNRLITKNEGGHITTFEYDANGNKIKETNFLGGVTSFSYDAFSNPITISQAHGGIITQKYDALGYIQSVTDPRCHTTKALTNIYGSPLKITHPDGSTQGYTYNLNGTTRSYTDQNGKTTNYTYDIFDNLLEETVHALDGELIGTITYKRNSFHLLEKTNLEGHKTDYSYNKAGQLIAETYADRKTEYEYDPLGRCIVEHTGDLHHLKEYDLQDRIIEEKQFDADTLFHKTSTEYKEAGLLVTKTRYPNNTPAQETTRYDLFGREIEHINALGQITQTTYEESDHLKKITTDPKGRKVLRTYNILDQLISIEKQSSNGKTITLEDFKYDLSGNQILRETTIFSNGDKTSTHKIEQTFDEMNRVAILTEQGDKTTEFGYTPIGKIKWITKPDGIELSYNYDQLDHRKSLSSSDGTILYSYTHNKLGDLISSYDHLTDDVFERIVDPHGNILRETVDNLYSIESCYDINGRRTRLALPNIEVIYTYLGHNMKSVGFDNHEHGYTYDLDGNIIQTKNIDGSETKYHLDPLSRVTSQSSPHFQQEISYDACGNILSMNYDGKQILCSYDDLDHLTQESDHSYKYDSIHNRLIKNEASYSINTLNQVISAADENYTYDRNGNLLSKGNIHFKYDALDRLIEVSTPTKTNSYTYDPEHRRLSKIIDGKATHYLWDGLHELGTFDTFRILGPTPHAEIGSAVAIYKEMTPHLPIHDAQGNQIKLITLDGQTVEHNDFSAFGESSSFKGIWGYASKRYDPETGLIYFGRRFYDPQTGRFITSDPEGYEDSANLYAYCLNNPLTHHDPYGLLMSVTAPLFNDYNQEDYKQGLLGTIQGAYHNFLDIGKSFFGDFSMKDPARFFEPESEYPLDDLFTKLGADHNHPNYKGLYQISSMAFDLGFMPPPIKFASGSTKLLNRMSKIIPAKVALKTRNDYQKIFRSYKAANPPNKNFLHHNKSGSPYKWPSPKQGRSLINEIEYTTHALERMAPRGLIQNGKEIISRGVPPSAVKNAINHGTKRTGNSVGEIVHTFENVRVVTDSKGKRVITVIIIGK